MELRGIPVSLGDAASSKTVPDIPVILEVITGTASDFIDVGFNQFEARVLLENCEGKLKVYVWCTQEEVLAGKPSYTAIIEPDEPEEEGGE